MRAFHIMFVSSLSWQTIRFRYEISTKHLNCFLLRGVSCAGALLFYDRLEWHERWGILCGALVLEPAECVQKTRPPSLFTKRTSRATGDHLPRQALDKTRKDKSLLKNGGVFRSQPQQLGLPRRRDHGALWVWRRAIDPGAPHAHTRPRRRAGVPDKWRG